MEIKAYVHAKWDTYEKKYGFFVWSIEDMRSSGYIPVGLPHILTIAPNESDMKNATIAAIRDEQQKIRAEAQSKFMQLEESIQSLLAIEHKQPDKNPF